MRKIYVGVMLLMTGLSEQVSADATATQARAFCEKAVAHEKKVGHAQAWLDWTEPQANSNGWKDEDLYIFAFNGNYEVAAHGVKSVLIGKNLKMMKSLDQADGTPGTYFIQDMMDLTSSGKSGETVTFNWTHPKTGENTRKVAFSYPYSDGTEGFFGCGYYGK